MTDGGGDYQIVSVWKGITGGVGGDQVDAIAGEALAERLNAATRKIKAQVGSERLFSVYQKAEQVAFPAAYFQNPQARVEMDGTL